MMANILSLSSISPRFLLFIIAFLLLLQLSFGSDLKMRKLGVMPSPPPSPWRNKPRGRFYDPPPNSSTRL
ncbi:hypothetical protein PHAVU_004G153084 [Phaseolus vulgaris]|uniref:Uncharacterized protein n=1 Tax=Phaseolus vulgaris TaxID=3885 RepID=V7BZS7_PHAVU|nr:hypothetical protein PHAVU_005G163300g [Phaseolus vulgaris]ESW22560.1 hypothetical protein PHAVU_005G163300g [Phaseolus vulgaris]